jgi:cation:H+ antiporter
LVAAAHFGLWKPHLEQAFARVGEVPFSSERKLMTTVHRLPSAEPRHNSVNQLTRLMGDEVLYVAFAKGAVDSLLGISDRVWTDGQAQPLTAEWCGRIQAANDRLAQEGLRVLGVAFSPIAALPADGQWTNLEREQTFVGMVGMIDPPQPEVKDAVLTCKAAGVRPVMITGDHPLTARQIARVSPEHKLNIVQALQRRGHVVAMTGDGVNDAPRDVRVTHGERLGEAMDVVTLLFFGVGLALLIVGAEAMVRGASRLAAAVGVSPLVIGLTVVAYGTSAPEMAVSVRGALAGQADILLGNVVGSNIFNVLFILGISATIAPLIVAQQLVRLEVPLVIVASVLLLLLALDGEIGRFDGLLLFTGMISYTVFAVRQSRRERKPVQAVYVEEFGNGRSRAGRQVIIQIALIVVGLACLVVGARWLVEGAVAMAQALGLSELIIGLTVVAAGTSLPEVATSIVASLRGERDIAVGNVIGSNLFNILGALGLASLVVGAGVTVSSAALRFDIPVMIAVSLACLPVFFTGNLIARWEGAIFLGYYLAYTLYLILKAVQHDALPAFSAIMLAFIMPLTVITLLVVVARSLRPSRPRPWR